MNGLNALCWTLAVVVALFAILYAAEGIDRYFRDRARESWQLAHEWMGDHAKMNEEAKVWRVEIPMADGWRRTDFWTAMREAIEGK